MTSPWKKVDFNQDTTLWEATTAAGVVLRVTGKQPPPAWLVEHHALRYAKDAPEVELGNTGCRIRMPHETEWRNYDYTPRARQ